MIYKRILAAASAASLLMAFMGVSSASETTREPNVGEAGAALQNLRNVRSGPGFQYPIMYQVPWGTALNIVCYTNDPRGNTWYQLGDGNYILASIAGGGGYPACVGVGFRP